MPISRTPMTDDDGSGTTGTIINNAWKQELYAQIDAYVGSVMLSFPLTDASGAALGSLGTGYYIRLADNIVLLLAQPIYPATASALPALVGGLPLPNGSASGGLAQVYGAHKLWWIKPGDSQIEPLNPTTSATMTNAQMSGSNNVLVGFYKAT